jgi:hypothetical protein
MVSRVAGLALGPFVSLFALASSNSRQGRMIIGALGLFFLLGVVGLFLMSGGLHRLILDGRLGQSLGGMSFGLMIGLGLIFCAVAGNSP